MSMENKVFLNTDAISVSNFYLDDNTNKDKLSLEILPQVEDDLDMDEKISILFLMVNDYAQDFSQVYDLLQNHKEHKSYILTEFISKYPINWENKLLEAISVINNRKIIKKLGILFEDLNMLYLPTNRSCSRYLNLTAKCLYLLCEAMTQDKIELLLQYVRSDIIKYNDNLGDTDFLELHMLYWMQENYISIHLDGKVQLKNLLKHLKTFDELELICEDLKKHECRQNVLDIPCSSANRVQSEPFSMRQGINMSNIEEEEIKTLNKGLCIIISQMYFAGQKFETRFGTMADCLKLSETFKGIGFTVEVFSNLKKDEILKKLENIPKEFGIDYDCIFVCILSHGCKGGIISSDEEEVSIEIIEHKFCCMQLKDVVKILVIQACQGKVTGQVNDNLAIDGFTNYITPNILAYKNFCIFMSTMQGFVSVRHKKEGSWFIQELCNIIQNGNKMKFSDVITRTIRSVTEKRGKLDEVESVGQMPEVKSYRLLRDFYMPEYKIRNNKDKIL
ncbi:caspase-8 Dredd [Xylocopa sonorina]|uniref:caspase-8 Dredd n=1 Tax=Xylocopa sonorina TaxID=1818115 RepID=UPI00403B1384